MIDNTKFLTRSQSIINRLILHPNFKECRPKTNNYFSLMHKEYGVKLSFDFRKLMKDGELIGFVFLEICVSPHYHFNNYKHNGNDFTPSNSIKSLIDIFHYIGISKSEFEELKVCNIEFGINLLPDTDIKKLVDGLKFYKRTPFKVQNYPYYKITRATSYKQIKAYAKGLQFHDYPDYMININTFRFEVKSKQSKKIKQYGIYTANDLMEIQTYVTLGQNILNEWENVLVINNYPKFYDINKVNKKYIEEYKKTDVWIQMYSVKFQREKEKYYKMLRFDNNLHLQVKQKIIDKLSLLFDVTNSTKKSFINKGNSLNVYTPSQLLNLENVTYNQNQTICYNQL